MVNIFCFYKTEKKKLTSAEDAEDFLPFFFYVLTSRRGHQTSFAWCDLWTIILAVGPGEKLSRLFQAVNNSDSDEDKPVQPYDFIISTSYIS